MRAKRISIVSAVALVLGAAALGAQTAPPAGIDPTAAVTLEGAVVSFGAGPGMPVLVVADAELGETPVILGPFWYLSEMGFSASAGNEVRVVAYPCTECPAGYVAASVENLTTGASIELRDEDGFPVWRGEAGRGCGPGHGPGPEHGGYGPHWRDGHRCCGACGGAGPNPGGPKPGGPDPSGPNPGGPNPGGPDPSGPDPDGPKPGWRTKKPGFRCQGRGPDLSAVTTVTGTVVAYEGGPGRKMPTLTLDAGGEWLEIFVGPNRVWMDAGFEPAVGQELAVTYAPALSESHLVALSVTEPTTGLTLALRDAETGVPTGGRCRGLCDHG